MISTRQAAKRLGLAAITLSHYISVGKVPAPKVVMVAGMKIHDWTEEEIEHVMQLLPKIKNGRKTRYQKQKSEARRQKSVEAKTQKSGGRSQEAGEAKTRRQKSKAKSKAKKKPQAKRPVPHKQARKKK